MQLTEDVLWIDCGAANVYLCRDDDGLTLIDTAMPRHAEQIFAAAADWGYQPVDLQRIIITHADIDHAGSLAAIQQQSDATVIAGNETAAFLLEGCSPKHLPAIMDMLAAVFMRYGKINADCLHVVADGEVLPVLGGLHAIASPGHTMDHMAFYSPSAGILFAGDALHTRNGAIERSQKRITADEDAANRSAVDLLALSPAIIACGHGAPSTNLTSSDLIPLAHGLRRTAKG